MVPDKKICVENHEATCSDYPDKCHACGAYVDNQKKESPVSIWPWILISVKDREITTEQFKTFAEAHEQMLNELEKEFDKGDYDQSWEEIKSLGEKVETSDFGFTRITAWSNVDDDCNCDWKIVSIM